MAIEQWLISGSQPESATDCCFNAEGQVIASGPKVWQAQGSCSQQYPPLSNSRRQAGAPLHGLMMQCQLMPVSQALARGDYFPIDMSSYLGQLERSSPRKSMAVPARLTELTISENSHFTAATLVEVRRLC
ncbi:DUF6351 family protein [Alishewanella longhuensis]